MASAKSECVNWLAGWVRPLFITHSDAHSGQFRMAIVTGAALAPAIALEDRNRMKCMVCATCTKARACAAKYFLRFYAMNFEPAPTQLKENAINWTVNWRWPSSQHPENETIILFPYYEQTHTMWPLDYPQTCLYCGLSGHNHAHTPEHMHVNPVQRHILHRPRANGQTGMCVCGNEAAHDSVKVKLTTINYEILIISLSLMHYKCGMMTTIILSILQRT